MLNNVENSMLLGSPFNESKYNREDECDRRERLSAGCKYKIDGECRFYDYGQPMCDDMDQCPDLRW